MTAFSGCMRANGEPSFPDPNAQGVISAGSLDRGSVQIPTGVAGLQEGNARRRPA
jgi:hypothetical protein